MSEYVVIEYSGRTSSRTKVYNTTLSATKRRMTATLVAHNDRVTIVESDDTTWTRHRGDPTWTQEGKTVTVQKEPEHDPRPLRRRVLRRSPGA